MGTVNVLAQMAEYDFNAPINVEMIFEDSDDGDDVSFQNKPSEQENITNDINTHKQFAVEKCETNRNQSNYEGSNKPMLSLKPIQEIIEDIVESNLNKSKNAEIRENTNDVGQNQNIHENRHATIVIDDDTVHKEQNVPVSTQINGFDNPVTTFIEDLLNKLSEHIVLIMQAFKHYGAKRANDDVKKNETIFHFITSHFFELSYTTVESIFLPQEQNETFINQFLDSTVSIANSKSLKWKCKRCHVLPFFNELMRWAKRKREYIQKNNEPCSSKINAHLKKQLVRPLAPLNLPQSEIIANYTNIEPPQLQNNLCIFSSGTPGNEISINIDTNTFKQITGIQNSGTATQNENQTNSAPSCPTTRRKTPAARPRYGNRVKDIQKKNPQYDRPRPPFNLCNNYKTISNRPQQYFQTTANNYDQINANQTYYNNMRQPQQITQNNHPNVNYPTQMSYINTHKTSACNDSLNYLLYNDNTNYNIPMHGPQMENQVTSSPVMITSVSSSMNPTTVRCCMCGKNTSRPCDSYVYSPSTPIYCSYLCQELDNQFYKRAWPNT